MEGIESLELAFSAANGLALLGWIALLLAVFFPRWKPARWIVGAALIPASLSAGYLALILFYFGGAEGGFGSLADVAKLFGHPGVLLAGWIHYLAFDLVLGCVEARDARRIGLSRWLLPPCFALTFLLGPVGFLLYWILRTIRTRSPHVLALELDDENATA